jgi:hypothetical protein
MTKGKLIPAILAVFIGAIAGLVAASPANATGIFKTIQRTNTTLCLGAASGGNGAAVLQVQCNVNDPAQGWITQNLSGGRVKFVNQLGFCMNAFGPVQNGTPILLIDCVTVSNEEWKPSKSLPNRLVTVQSRAGNRDNGHCIDVPGGQLTPGLAVQIWQCNGTGAQLFDVFIV